MSSTSASQPPIVRGAMTPRPWAPGLLRRLLQSLLGRGKTEPYVAPPRGPLKMRRILLLVLIAAGAWLGTSTMAEVLPNYGPVWLQHSILALFALLFAWISAGFWTGVMGAWVMLRGYDKDAITNVLSEQPSDEPIDPAARTAIVMPICNEHVPTVFGGLRATFESLRATGSLDRFDFFILSDTSNPDLRAAEQAAYGALLDELNIDGEAAGGRVYYRWRQHRQRRKAGNVADFCRRWGRSYRYMVVLDADSVMTGDCLTSLVKLMQAHPDAGIIQTAPRACGHVTLHARVQQFGARVYGPLFTAGMHYWQLGESHYWGHNAILRVEAFMKHCGLAALSGRGPLSGEIMSHDFVEAALMRRAGYKVWIAYDLPGSYEQVPPNLISELQRDRRWCHGNLQNSRLMTQPKLHPVHRSVFLTGLLAYLSAPLWLGFLVLSTLLLAEIATGVPRYFSSPYQLFPMWPTVNFGLIVTLFSTTVVLLFGPKVLALAVIILQGRAREFGGSVRLLVGAVVEFLYNMLLAPVRMLFHSQFVLGALCGWRTGWTSPPRDDDATPWREALRRHGVHSLLSIAWLVAVVIAGSAFPWWLTPIFGGLLLSAPLSVWGSRASNGLRLQRFGLLSIPEEQDEPEVLRRARRYAERAPRSPCFAEAVGDMTVSERAMRASLARGVSRGRKGRARDALIRRALQRGPDALNAKQRLRLLGDPHALRALRAAINESVNARGRWMANVPQPQTAVVPTGPAAEPAGRMPQLGVAGAR